MTHTLIDHADSGEIPRLPGEARTVILRAETGEPTQRIDPRLIKAPSFDAVPRKTFDIDDTVVYRRDTVVYHLPPTVEVVPDLLEGPQKPPPPLPKPKADPAETGVNIFGGLGADLPEQPWPVPAPATVRSRCRHKVKSAWWRGVWTGLAIAVGVGVAVYAGQVLAAGVVIW